MVLSPPYGAYSPVELQKCKHTMRTLCESATVQGARVTAAAEAVGLEAQRATWR